MEGDARPWYRKKRYLLPIGAVVVLAAIGGLTDEEATQSADNAEDVSATDDEPTSNEDSSAGGSGDDADPEPQASRDDADQDNEGQGADDEAQDEGGGRPTISDDAIAEAERFMGEETLVQDVSIEVDGDEVMIALIVNSAITDDAARNLLDSATRYLATQVAINHDSLEAPGSEHLGDVWDHYTLQVLAGTGPGDVRVHGAKVPGSPRISW